MLEPRLVLKEINGIRGMGTLRARPYQANPVNYGRKRCKEISVPKRQQQIRVYKNVGARLHSQQAAELGCIGHVVLAIES